MKERGRAGHETILRSPSSPQPPAFETPNSIAPPLLRRNKWDAAPVESKDDGGAASARKLGAGIWQRQIELKRFSASAVHGYPMSPCVCKLKNSHLHGDLVHRLWIKREMANFAMERATKWESKTPEFSGEIGRLLDHLNLLPDEQSRDAADDHRFDLDGARNRVADLEAECDLWRKKLRHLFGKTLARRRDEEKRRLAAIGLEAELRRERKERKLQETLNLKLAGDVAAAEAAARRRRRDYEEEKKARELVEEMCGDLADEAVKTRAEIEALRKEIAGIREEVDLERRMLQVAETWREERVRMKLMDAKLAMEEKRSQVSELRPDLQRYLQREEEEDDSSWEGTMSRSEELDSSVPSVGTEGEAMAAR